MCFWTIERSRAIFFAELRYLKLNYFGECCVTCFLQIKGRPEGKIWRRDRHFEPSLSIPNFCYLRFLHISEARSLRSCKHIWYDCILVYGAAHCFYYALVVKLTYILHLKIIADRCYRVYVFFFFPPSSFCMTFCCLSPRWSAASDSHRLPLHVL